MKLFNLFTMIAIILIAGCAQYNVQKSLLLGSSNEATPVTEKFGEIPGNRDIVTNVAELHSDLNSRKLDRDEMSADNPDFVDEVVRAGTEPVSNLVIKVRDRFYDPELDVTWKRNVTGGRIFYDVEAIGDTANQNQGDQ